LTVKLTPLLTCPPTLTTTFPVVAPLGTGATSLVLLQLVGVAAVPLNLTALVPCVLPKFAPVIVTDVPTAPDVGLTAVRLGGGGGGAVTVKEIPLLAWPPTITTMFPVVAPLGTGAPRLVPLQLVGVAGIPLNVTVLAPCVVPKFAPVTVTGLPTVPAVGVRLVRLGGGDPLAVITVTLLNLAFVTTDGLPLVTARPT